MKKKTVLIAIHSLKVGGMERVASILATNFQKRNDIEVHLVLYGKQPEIFYQLHPEVRIHKPSFEFNDGNRLISTFKRMLFLRESIKKLHPDSVLSLGEYWNNLVLLATIGLGVPVYISDRSTPMKNLGSIQNLLRNLLYPRANGLIVQTEKAKARYRLSFRKMNIEVIGNPIDETGQENEVDRENIILTVGRLIKTKHIDRLIKIFSELKTVTWQLVIVGADSKKQNIRSQLEQQVLDLGLKNQVIFAGNQKNVVDFYRKSKIFAFTSSSEGFPNVIGEAMSSGLPVVSYDCLAGPSEIITDNQDGFLVALFNDILFKEKIQYLIENEQLRSEMGKRAAHNIQRFSADKISEKFLNTILD